MAIELPKTKKPAEKQDPKNLLIFSKPKQGKSSALAELPGALCIDLEDGGYDYIDAVKIKANSVSDIKEICKAIKEADYPYQFIVLDTITALEEIIEEMQDAGETDIQIEVYRKPSKNYKGKDFITCSII